MLREKPKWSSTCSPTSLRGGERPKGTPTPTRPRQAAVGSRSTRPPQARDRRPPEPAGHRDTPPRARPCAVEVLAGGGPESVSANLVAKQAGSPGAPSSTSSATPTGCGPRSSTTSASPPTGGSQRSRPAVPRVRRSAPSSKSLWDGYGTPPSRAVRNLRVALPHDPDVLRRDYPRTAASLHEFKREWNPPSTGSSRGWQPRPRRCRTRPRSLLPERGARPAPPTAAGKGIDPNEAKRGLIDALVAYLA